MKLQTKIDIRTQVVAASEQAQARKMERYYAFHAKIYDTTRWSFLFGRRKLVDTLPLERLTKKTIFEIGCGTGFNLLRLSKNFPKARLIGFDISKIMVVRAEEKLRNIPNKLEILNQAYGEHFAVNRGEVAAREADVVIFSYCLTMVNPNWEILLDQAYCDLKPGGLIAVVDFHTSKSGVFKTWMGKNHVRMDAHILPYLQTHFQTKQLEVTAAYGGLWQYFSFVGEKV
jgi:S-adenosylmethionine-diacylgycerolhomoserine-N-methlytransferase